jgi:hypothetical protein
MYLTQLRKLFSQKTESPIYVSDRRWVKIGKLLRTSAFLNDRMSVGWSDLILLRHCLWNQVEEIPLITTDILSAKVYKETKEFESIVEQLNTIKQRRIWVDPLSKGRKNTEAERVKSFLSKTEDDISVLEGKILTGLNQFRKGDNIFVSQEDINLIDAYMSDFNAKMEKIEDTIYEQKKRFP